MPYTRARQYEEELMDDLSGAGPDWAKTLDELETINRLLGGYTVTREGIGMLLKRDPSAGRSRPLRLADLGCGGGDGLRVLAKWARKEGLKVELVGIDANAFIVEYAREHSQAYPEISYRAGDVFGDVLAEAGPFDIVHASLFTHHFNEAQLVGLLRKWKASARLGVMLNDLHRHPFAYRAIAVLTRALAKSPLIRHDAKLSVARGFSKEELEAMLREAGVEEYTLAWRWAWRWLAVF